VYCSSEKNNFPQEWPKDPLTLDVPLSFVGFYRIETNVGCENQVMRSQKISGQWLYGLLSVYGEIQFITSSSKEVVLCQEEYAYVSISSAADMRRNLPSGGTLLVNIFALKDEGPAIVSTRLSSHTTRNFII
jgi:hypothetical protein